MLVGSCMIDSVNFEFFYDIYYPLIISDGCQDRKNFYSTFNFCDVIEQLDVDFIKIVF